MTGSFFDVLQFEPINAGAVIALYYEAGQRESRKPHMY